MYETCKSKELNSFSLIFKFRRKTKQDFYEGEKQHK